MNVGQPNQRTCATCGESAGPNDRYCRHCGAPLSSPVASTDASETRADFPTQRINYTHEPSTPPADEFTTDESQAASDAAHSFEATTSAPHLGSEAPSDQQYPPRPTWQAQSFSDLREEKKPNRNMWWIIGIAIAVVLLFCCCMLIGIAAVAAEDNALHRELEHIFLAISSIGLLS